MKNFTAIINDLRTREAGAIRRIGAATPGSRESVTAKENLAIIEDALKRNFAEAKAELADLTS